MHQDRQRANPAGDCPPRRRLVAETRRRTLVGAAAGPLGLGAAADPHEARATAAAAEPLVRVGGSGMALGVMLLLGAGYRRVAAGVLVHILPNLGSTGGIAALGAGAIEVAVSGRALNDRERRAGARELATARTLAAFTTDAATAAEGVTLAGAAEIDAGARVRWPDGSPIRVVRRDASDSDVALLHSLSCEMAHGITAALQRQGLVTAVTDQDNADALERLRALGVAIAMDDFSTGYSSLGYLQTFRFDKIKIDRSFIGGLGDDRHADAVVRAAIGISRAMGVRANAEGVETEDQAERLHLEGCDEVQGYLFGRPMGAEAFVALLAGGERPEGAGAGEEAAPARVEAA